MTPDAERLISELQLEAHPEGGYYRQNYRSNSTVTTADGQRRSAVTNIYFLLTGDSFSAWHRIDADETWHFYHGSDISISIINEDGSFEERRLGPAGPWQMTVPACCYFTAHVPDSTFALVGCTVAPGFAWSSFEIPTGEALTELYPQHAAAILRFTRKS